MKKIIVSMILAAIALVCVFNSNHNAYAAMADADVNPSVEYENEYNSYSFTKNYNANYTFICPRPPKNRREKPDKELPDGRKPHDRYRDGRESNTDDESKVTTLPYIGIESFIDFLYQ